MQQTENKSIDESIAELYELHRHGELSDLDKRWMDVRSLLKRYASLVVRERCPPNIHGPLREQAVGDLSDELLEKFIRRVFNHEGTNMLPLLRRVAANALVQCFRRRRSLTCLSGWATDRDDDPIEGSWEATIEREQTTDLFAQVRDAMQPFRFVEHQLVREAILAYFLTHQTYPGEKFLIALGVRHHRTAIYNAAVFDLNRAMKQVVVNAN